MFTVGQKCWTPDSEKFGQGVISEIGQDGDVRVTHIDIHGRKNERWFDCGVIQLVPTPAQLEVQASNTFRAAHLKANDFNPCKANVQMMTDFMRANHWPWTAPNLERAFVALRLKLAPLAPGAAPVTPAAVPTTPAPAAPATPAITPTAPATPTLTKKEVASWSGAVMREKMQDPEIAKQMAELGIPVLKTLDANRGRTKKN